MRTATGVARAQDAESCKQAEKQSDGRLRDEADQKMATIRRADVAVNWIRSDGRTRSFDQQQAREPCQARLEVAFRALKPP